MHASHPYVTIPSGVFVWLSLKCCFGRVRDYGGRDNRVLSGVRSATGEGDDDLQERLSGWFPREDDARMVEQAGRRHQVIDDMPSVHWFGRFLGDRQSKHVVSQGRKGWSGRGGEREVDGKGGGGGGCMGNGSTGIARESVKRPSSVAISSFVTSWVTLSVVSLSYLCLL